MQKEFTDIIFGIHPVLEAFEAGVELERLYLQTGTKGTNIDKIKNLAKTAGVPINEVPVFKLNKFTRKNHQGVIVVTSPIKYQQIEEIIQSTFEKGQEPKILILDRITDVRNIGAIARSADAFGFHAIVVPQKGTALINAEAMKSSAGALNYVPVCRVRFLDNTIKYLKDSGLSIISCTEKTDETIQNLSVKVPLAIIMGSEEDGISPKYLELSDYKVKIPMKGHVGSLNVSVAAGIIMHQVSC